LFAFFAFFPGHLGYFGGKKTLQPQIKQPRIPRSPRGFWLAIQFTIIILARNSKFFDRFAFPTVAPHLIQ
jgi:hypothetical protein